MAIKSLKELYIESRDANLASLLGKPDESMNSNIQPVQESMYFSDNKHLHYIIWNLTCEQIV